MPRYIALLIFFVMAISDAFDGWLARRTNSVTELGKFLDPLADKILITCSCILLATPSTAIDPLLLPKVIVVIVIGKDLYTVMGFMVIYFLTSKIHIVPCQEGKISTTLQLCMVLGILISPEVIRIFSAFVYVIQFLWWLCALMAVLTIIAYTRKGAKFVNEYEHGVHKVVE